MQNIWIISNGILKLLWNIKPVQAACADELRPRFLRELAPIDHCFVTSNNLHQLPSNYHPISVTFISIQLIDHFDQHWHLVPPIIALLSNIHLLTTLSCIRQLRHRIQSWNQVQNDLTNLMIWERDWLMNINLEKCEVIRLSGKKSPIMCEYTLHRVRSTFVCTFHTTWR